MLKITIVVGNPKANSRTLLIAEKLVNALLGPTPADIQVIDLADHYLEIFAWPNDDMATLSSRVASSDLIVVASPTYKASYTGLLKAFLDRYPANGLGGTIAIPLMTGADANHAMGGDTHLAPLLTELGALVLGRSLYVVTGQMDQVDAIVDEAATDLRQRLQTLRALAEKVLPASEDTVPA